MFDELFKSLQTEVKRTTKPTQPPKKSTQAAPPTTFTFPEGMKAISAKDLLEMELPPFRWLVPNLIPRTGIGFIAGPHNDGTSAFPIYVAIAVANRDRLFADPQFHSTGGDVLLLSPDETKRTLHQRIVQACAAEQVPPPANLYFFTKWPNVQQGALSYLEAWLRTYPETRLVVIDTFRHLQHPYDPQTIIDLRDLARRMRVFILLTHHAERIPQYDPYRFLPLGIHRGSIDLLIHLRPRHSNGTLMQIMGKDFNHSTHLLVQNGDALRVTPAVTGGLQCNEKAAILAAIDRGATTPAAIARMLNISPGTCRVRLCRMRRYGLITKGPHGYAKNEV